MIEHFIRQKTHSSKLTRTRHEERICLAFVLIFPTLHKGGALILLDNGEEWSFDSVDTASKHSGPHVGYVAFYSDVEHEVTTV